MPLAAALPFGVYSDLLIPRVFDNYLIRLGHADMVAYRVRADSGENIVHAHLILRGKVTRSASSSTELRYVKRKALAKAERKKL